MEIRTAKISDLKPHPRNPRTHPDAAINSLVKSIKEFGWTAPVLVSRDGFILAGHARLKAAERAGLTEVPAVFLDLNGDQADAYLVADNKLNQLSGWDLPLLKDLIADIQKTDISISALGYERKEVDELLAGPNIKDLAAEIVGEKEYEAAAKTADEILERLTKQILTLAEKDPRKLNGALAVIIDKDQGNQVLFLADPKCQDLIIEIKRYIDAGETSPLECLLNEYQPGPT